MPNSLARSRMVNTSRSGVPVSKPETRSDIRRSVLSNSVTSAPAHFFQGCRSIHLVYVNVKSLRKISDGARAQQQPGGASGATDRVGFAGFRAANQPARRSFSAILPE